MKKIGIVVDAAVDLPQEIIEKHQIALVPVKMDWPDLENMPGENTFQKIFHRHVQDPDIRQES